MRIKDDIVSWFIQNIIIPKTEIIDQPGFIVLRLSEKKQTTYLREIVFPEDILIELEKKISKKYGERGEKSLYSIGKRFGYRYSAISKYPTVKNSSEKDVKEFLYLFLRYMESTYARKLGHSVDIKSKVFEMEMDEYIVCSYNGLGFILTSGGSAGTWAYISQDPSMEAVETDCQGRGDKNCKVVCAPKAVLNKMGLKFYTEEKIDDLRIDQNYVTLNKIVPPRYAKHSFKNLIDSNVFSFSRGIAKYNNVRHFLLESSLVYMLEEGLKGLPDSEKILFDVSFDVGKKIAGKGKKNSEKSVSDYMSAVGWGDIMILTKNKKYIVSSYSFPWTKFSKGSKYVIYRGLLSGLLSGFIGKKIIFSRFDTDVTSRGLNVVVYEK